MCAIPRRRFRALTVASGTPSWVTQNKPVAMCDAQCVAGSTYCQASVEPIMTFIMPLPPELAVSPIAGTPVSGLDTRP